jgi:uncharacterized protein YecT (DUF1311 family)
MTIVYRISLWMAALAISTNYGPEMLRADGGIPVNTDAHSKGAEAVREYDACMRRRPGDLVAAAQCDYGELARVDKVLNETYRSLMKRLTPMQQQRLQAMERRWIAQADPFCDAEALRTLDALDDSDDPTEVLTPEDRKAALSAQDTQLLKAGCLLDRTGQRLEWLRTMGELLAP